MSYWLPTFSVILLAALALTWAGSPPATAIGRRWWMAGLFVIGSLAISATVWEQRKEIDETAAVAGTTMPQAPYRRPNEADLAALTQQVKTLTDRVRLLEEGKQVRFIGHEAGENLTAYLKQFSSRRVVVSCVPGNLEAYQYASQLVNLLKAANWDAHGPEVTKIFGDVRSPAINVYVNPTDNSDTAKILLDGFAKFNIPYQSRVTPTQAIPDAGTVELFIGNGVSEPVSAAGD